MLLFIILFAPACIATLLYERLKPGIRSIFRWFILTICFSFIINLIVYVADWLVGQTRIYWSIAENLSYVPFLVKYMGLALLIAIILPLITVRIGLVLDKKNAGFDNSMETNNDVK